MPVLSDFRDFLLSDTIMIWITRKSQTDRIISWLWIIVIYLWKKIIKNLMFTYLDPLSRNPLAKGLWSIFIWINWKSNKQTILSVSNKDQFCRKLHVSLSKKTELFLIWHFYPFHRYLWFISLLKYFIKSSHLLLLYHVALKSQRLFSGTSSYS